MRKVILPPLFSLFLSLLFIGPATANDWRHPSRMRLLFHGDLPLTDELKLDATFIPAGNLLGELDPIIYLGPNYQVWPALKVVPIIGWAYKPDEPILALQLFPEVGEFRSWIDIEWYLPSNRSYVFGFLQYQFFPWLRAGAEIEAWGNWTDHSSWTTVVGPDIRFIFYKKILRIDLACQFRSLQGKWQPEFVSRIHLFFEGT